MPGVRIDAQTREWVLYLLRRQTPYREIIELTGVSDRSVYRIRMSVGGVLRPLDAEYDCRYLTRDERREIAWLREGGVSIRQIAVRLGRAPSTISRELRRNCHPRAQVYLPEHAHTMAWRAQRRPKRSKLATHQRLRVQVQTMLDQRWSPEQIAGRLRLLFPDDKNMQISHESIYQSLFVYPRGELTRELTAHLRRGRTTRRPRGHPRAQRNRITGLVSIHDRPGEVEARLVPGHHEGDLIKGSTASNSAVGTIVERHSGYLTLLHLPNGHTAVDVADAVVTQMSALPAWFTKTLTWDRGTEMAQHADITARTGITVYFADPYHPWQRPSNENTNGLLREYLPKGTDLSTHTRHDLDRIADQLNDRPRKRLNYQTPREVFANLITQDLTNPVATTP